MRINFKYSLGFIALFIIEVLIALYVRDSFVRPYLGDVLVVILLYCLVRSILSKRIKLLPMYLFFFATLVEVAQYFRIIEVLRLKSNTVLSTAVGSSFDVKDVLCYLTGAVLLFIWEKVAVKF